MIFWESPSSTFWLHLVWGLHTGGQHAINFFHLVGVLVSAKQLKGIVHNIIYSSQGGTKGL